MTAESIVICCNANAKVGLGHLMRSREMCRHLTSLGYSCFMYGPEMELAVSGDASLFADWIPETREEATNPQRRAEKVVALANSAGARRMLIDDYRADIAFQSVLAAAGIYWLQQFDNSLAWSYLSPVLVNASPWERPEHYTGRLPNPCTQLLFGPRYAVIRPEFRTIEPPLDKRPCRRILISFGGGDDRGMIEQALRAVSPHLQEGMEVLAISGPANPRLESVAEAMKMLSARGVRLLVDPANMAAVIATCDLGIIAGGTMGYELAILGVPPVFIALAPNQERSCRGWQALTGAPYLGEASVIDGDELRTVVDALISDGPRRAALAAAGRAAVDGLGTDRLCAALLERNCG